MAEITSLQLQPLCRFDTFSVPCQLSQHSVNGSWFGYKWLQVATSTITCHNWNHQIQKRLHCFHTAQALGLGFGYHHLAQPNHFWITCQRPNNSSKPKMLKHAKTIQNDDYMPPQPSQLKGKTSQTYSFVPFPTLNLCFLSQDLEQHGTTIICKYLQHLFWPALISFDPWVCLCLLIGDDFACLWQFPFPEDL